MDRTHTLTLLGNRKGGYPYIELLVGKEKGKLYELSRDHMSIGRSDESDILFASDAVSRIHALISREEDGWHIRDNQSKNGIQVNGTKHDNVCMQSGDLVQVGDFVFRFLDPSKAKAKTVRKPRNVNLAQTPGARLMRGAPSPVWFVGALLGGLVYLLLSPALSRPKATAQKELVISAPPAKSEATETAQTQSVAGGQLDNAAKALAAAHAEVAHKVAEAPVKMVADSSAVRPITREDLTIKTRKNGKKVESGKSLKIYLEEGQHYLSQGDFESASIAYNFAILIDPRNPMAIQGMEAAQAGVRDVSSVAQPERESQSVALSGGLATKAAAATAAANQETKKKQVQKLFEVATGALITKKYQKAIDTAEEIRRIEIKGETTYLNEAKQVIDQAKIKQKDEFEPFIKQANFMISEKAFGAARELCDQMLKRDEAYTPAKDCRDRAEAGLGRQASSGGAK